MQGVGGTVRDSAQNPPRALRWLGGWVICDELASLGVLCSYSSNKLRICSDGAQLEGPCTWVGS